ncbi:MAG: thiol peroxidase [Gammaproteobacteria bacterium]|nr:MAG: thiol peroxidase [Gammaproteobacteria bacterium]
MATVTLKGNACQTSGDLPAVGSAAPDFLLVDVGLADRSLSDYSGKKKLISIVPSLDTPVCALSTKKFNEYASQHSDTVILVVAADLPFAMGRFCGAEGTDNVVPLSMMRTKQFADDYGVLLTDGPLAGVTARAIVVLDENNQVIYSELVGEIGDEPDYEAALAALS